MQAGKLRQRIEFHEPITAQDETGDELVTWSPAFTLWGYIEPLTGREQLIANQTIAEGVARLRLRWSDQAARINAKWRASHRGTLYNLQSVAHLGTGRREIEIMARSGVNSG